MSEDKTDKPLDPNGPLFYNVMDPSVPAVYANDMCAFVLSTEVFIAFGDGSKTPDGHARTVAKVVMTHAQFVKCVAYLNTRCEYIKTVLGDRLPNIEDAFNADPDRVKDAITKYITHQPWRTEEEDANAKRSE
jgi:hypothetical protein